CAPCRSIRPTLEQISEVEEGNVQVEKINVDKQRALAQKLDVKGIPNSLVLVDGEIKGGIAGKVSYDEQRIRYKS
ncbi:thioredoxin, partial [Listeria monocytogenes]|uniref:thioredoxin family protein n=1 Tax=Listeria monocytogenes TaxID=1639 RepID=UPI000D8929BE